MDELGRQLRREAEAVGLMKADRQVALCDGGSGLEAVLKKFFPRATIIMDFWHAKEHLLELAGALHPHDEAARKAWLDSWCHQLKHEGGRAVLARLESLDLGSHGESVREIHRQQVAYFRNQAQRMDYPAYFAHGWQIGSGPNKNAYQHGFPMVVINNHY